MWSLEHVQAFGTWFLSFVIAVGVAIGAIRTGKKKDDTTGRVEDAKQASAQVYIDQLKDSRADASAMRDINEQLRKHFEAAFDEFHEKLQVANSNASDNYGEAVQLRGEVANLTVRVEELLAQIEKTRLTHEWEQQVWRNRHGTLQERYRILVNEKYGDGTATNIMGPIE